MTERQNGRHLPNPINHIERGALHHGKVGVVVFAPRDPKHMGRYHDILGPVVEMPHVSITDALAPGRVHRQNPDAFLQLQKGNDFGGLLSDIAGTVDHAFVLISPEELRSIIPHLMHDLSNGSGGLQQKVTVCVPGGSSAVIAEINQGVGKEHGFTVVRI